MAALTDLLAPTRKCAASSLRQASRAVTQHYEKHFRGSGLRSTQFTILSVLAQMGPIPVTRLAARLGLDRTTLTRNLRPLVDRRLVTLTPDQDARVRRAALTPLGETTVVGAFPRWQAAQASVGTVLSRFGLTPP